MGPAQPNQPSDSREIYLEIAAREARANRASQQRYARLMHDRGLDDSRIMAVLDIDRGTLDRMLATDGRIMDPDCAQRKHRACIGETWSDAKGDIVQCECECHDAWPPDMVTP